MFKHVRIGNTITLLIVISVAVILFGTRVFRVFKLMFFIMLGIKIAIFIVVIILIIGFSNIIMEICTNYVIFGLAHFYTRSINGRCEVVNIIIIVVRRSIIISWVFIWVVMVIAFCHRWHGYRFVLTTRNFTMWGSIERKYVRNTRGQCKIIRYVITVSSYCFLFEIFIFTGAMWFMSTGRILTTVIQWSQIAGKHTMRLFLACQPPQEHCLSHSTSCSQLITFMHFDRDKF